MMVTLFMGDSSDQFPLAKCHFGEKNFTVPATITAYDYVGVCRYVIHVASCIFPSSTFILKHEKLRPKIALDLGPQLMADAALKGAYHEKPIYQELFPERADKRPRNVVMCISRVFAFEKWQILVAAMEVYRALNVDLVVTHIYSVLTSVYKLMKAYEAEGRLAIRMGIELPVTEEMNSDPNLEIEYSGQVAMAYECFYEFRESAKFIALVDWDDLLITAKHPSLYAALSHAANLYPNAPYFYINKLESAYSNEDIAHPGIQSNQNLLHGIRTKLEFNSEKMVIRPSRVNGFWIHWSKHFSSRWKPVQLRTDDLLIVHLSKEFNSTHEMAKVGDYDMNLVSNLNFKSTSQKSAQFFSDKDVAEIMRSLPKNKKGHYFETIRQCSKYLNNYPILVQPCPCLSYKRCDFPKKMENVPCVMSKSIFNTTAIRPANIYHVHKLTHSEFGEKLDGCF